MLEGLFALCEYLISSWSGGALPLEAWIKKNADLVRLASSEASWSCSTMFVRRIWISKLINEERTHKVEYGKLYIIVCSFIYMYIYVRM